MAHSENVFRFQSFHMRGAIGSAALTGILSPWLLLRWLRRTALMHDHRHVHSYS